MSDTNPQPIPERAMAADDEQGAVVITHNEVKQRKRQDRIDVCLAAMAQETAECLHQYTDVALDQYGLRRAMRNEVNRQLEGK